MNATFQSRLLQPRDHIIRDKAAAKGASVLAVYNGAFFALFLGEAQIPPVVVLKSRTLAPGFKDFDLLIDAIVV